MTTANSPSNGYYQGGIYNPKYFIPIDNSGITNDYLQDTYLQRIGNANSIANNTSFSGQIVSINATNASTGSGAIQTLGGISSSKDLFVGTANILTNASSSNIFTNSSNINLGNQSTGNVNINGLIINSGNLNTNNGTANVMTNANAINIGSLGGTVNMNKINASSDITTLTGNLITTNNSGNIFVDADIINIGSNSSVLNTNEINASNDVNVNGNITTSNNLGNIFTTCSSIVLGKSTGTLNTGAITCPNLFITNATIDSSNGTASIFTNSANISIGSNASNSNLTINNKQLSVSGNLNINATQQTFNSGTNYVSGSIICSQPLQGSSIKLVMISLINVKTSANGTWTITYNFPKTFVVLPFSIVNYDTNSFTINISTSNVQIISQANLNNVSGGCLLYGY